MPIIENASYKTSRERNSAMGEILGRLEICDTLEDFNRTMQEVQSEIDRIKHHEETTNQMASSHDILMQQIDEIKTEIINKEIYRCP